MSYLYPIESLLVTQNCQNCLNCKQVPGSFNGRQGLMRCKLGFWLDSEAKDKTVRFRRGYWNTANILKKYPLMCGEYDYMDLNA